MIRNPKNDLQIQEQSFRRETCRQRADNVKLERTIKRFLKNIKFQLVRAREASVVWSYPFLLLFGGAAVDGVDGEAVSLAAGLALSLGVSVNQGADGAADHGGVVTGGDAAGWEGCRNKTDGESGICWGAPKISEQKCSSLKVWTLWVTNERSIYFINIKQTKRCQGLKQPPGSIMKHFF